jgi:hypothetical protein
MCSVIDNAPNYEIHEVIHFPYAKNMSCAELPLNYANMVYAQNVMSEGNVRE